MVFTQVSAGSSPVRGSMNQHVMSTEEYADIDEEDQRLLEKIVGDLVPFPFSATEDGASSILTEGIETTMISPMKLDIAGLPTNAHLESSMSMIHQYVANLKHFGALGSFSRSSEARLSDIITDAKLTLVFESLGAQYILLNEDRTAVVWIEHSSRVDSIDWVVYIFGESNTTVSALKEDLEGRLPMVKFDDETLQFTFRNLAPDGTPVSRSRMLQINRWKEIYGNYPLELSRKLEALMKFRISGDISGGKLILWHGPPGGGKTNAIRALGDAWRSWAKLSYIVDPEAFFGRSYYMLDTMTAHDGSDLWHVVVIEDAGEYLSSKASADTGQGLSRLLNLTDGIVGQGTKLLLLMTTNEPIQKLHPAVSREGRCLATMSFDPFPVAEANKWLMDHQVNYRVTSETSLAELYSFYNGAKTIRADREEITVGGYA